MNQGNSTTWYAAFIISFNVSRGVKNSILSHSCYAFNFLFNGIILDLHFYVILETEGLSL